MYHRANDPQTGADPKKLEDHLCALAQKYPIVLPGDPLSSDKMAVCLTFDDAFYDFYHTVFPLLIKHQLKALLAVPVAFIQDHTNHTAEKRLSLPYPKGFSEAEIAEYAPFCTWPELKEMADSGLVEIASHAYSHPHLAKDHCDLEKEIVGSKMILEDKLKTTVKSFVYPFGNMSPAVHQQVKAHYDYGFRIGSALNFGWQGNGGLLYRVDAENYWKKDRVIGLLDLLKFGLKNMVNQVRGK